jgi:hypothetical protein
MLVGVHLHHLARALELEEQGHERFVPLPPWFSPVGGGTALHFCSSAWLVARPDILRFSFPLFNFTIEIKVVIHSPLSQPS